MSERNHLETEIVDDNLHQLQVTVLPDGRMDSWNAALYLGLSRKTLAMWRYEKTGPRYIKRGRIFYYKQDLDAWLNGVDWMQREDEA